MKLIPKDRHNTVTRRGLFSLSSGRVVSEIAKPRADMTLAERVSSDRRSVALANDETRRVVVFEGQRLAHQEQMLRRRALQSSDQHHRPTNRAQLSRRTFLAASAATVATTKVYADTPFTSFAFPGTSRSTNRTTPDRIADIFNVLDFGADASGSGDSTTAISSAITAANAVGGTLFFPIGHYKVTSTIELENASSQGLVVLGSSRWGTYIFGTIDNGFIFRLRDGQNGPNRISNLSLVNPSTNIGSGALMFNNDTCGLIENCHFQGMLCVLLPYNIFQTTILACTGESNSNVSTGHVGTFGIAGFHCNVTGWRTTSNFQAGIQFYGSNSALIYGCGIENCTAAYIAGMQTGWASACTVSTNVITIGGDLGTLDGGAPFIVGTEIFMSGLSTTSDWGISPIASTRCTITETHAENPSRTGTGFAGTYTISRSATVASPVPIVSRRFNTISGTEWHSLTSEACYYIAFIYGAAGNTFNTVSGGSTVAECTNAFGTPGFAATAGIYIYSGLGACSFISCSPNNNPTLASWYIDPNGGDSHITFTGCLGQKVVDTVTGTSSSISNGSGGAGTILNVVSATTGGSVNIGTRVFVSGSQVATITGNSVTDGTLTGAGGLGTYRVDTSQLVTGIAITIKWGDDWVMPTSSSAKTALEFVNCTSANLPAGYTTGLNSLNRTFTSLPGQAGANNNYPVYYGMEYDIVDSNTATWGATVAAGGSNKIRTRYNGTNWTVVGK